MVVVVVVVVVEVEVEVVVQSSSDLSLQSGTPPSQTYEARMHWSIDLHGTCLMPVSVGGQTNVVFIVDVRSRVEDVVLVVSLGVVNMLAPAVLAIDRVAELETGDGGVCGGEVVARTVVDTVGVAQSSSSEPSSQSGTPPSQTYEARMHWSIDLHGTCSMPVSVGGQLLLAAAK